MYKIVCFLISALGVLSSCVKPPTEDPVPTLQFQRVENMKQVISTGGSLKDTAVLVLRYSDGDGDIFRDANDDGPNLIFATHVFNVDSNKFILFDKYNPATITQPANGYYKGKAIHGDIFLPITDYRNRATDSILKFEAFIVDMKGNKSNVVVSPTYTLNF